VIKRCIIIDAITIPCFFWKGLNAMAIKVTCSCGKKLRAKEEAAGKRAKCPACGNILTVPASRASHSNIFSKDEKVNATHSPPETESPEWQSDLRPLS
jgi:predicted RNA-binding Zn-ribbon protein involved in translation (DUF1610 family)